MKILEQLDIKELSFLFNNLALDEQAECYELIKEEINSNPYIHKMDNNKE